jgi:hypothetical protein
VIAVVIVDAGAAIPVTALDAATPAPIMVRSAHHHRVAAMIIMAVHRHVVAAAVIMTVIPALRESAADRCRQQRQGGGCEKYAFHESLLFSR